MATVHDVAAHILAKQGGMTAMKLQKLVYYSYAWHLVWEERELFDAPIQAWANGPVIYDLYRHHRGQFHVSTWPLGDAEALDTGERESIDIVLGFYSDKTAHELSELTHSEAPWQDARGDLPAGSRSSTQITTTSIFDYYDSLTHAAAERV
ncbi:conserved hypothetical protein [Beutenbergia cavernae DSM 12333]|uniref:Antitoxin SocA-like Panacea domain-containing protein n=1 Tax=Beutenbergia cavernae (strain ATCC BAA-8 / DSM 12333 / CCUG 43141 / JCM 11478 / NBRC 16432 / NCIMB 13614 / HKI 0122) TaxID=471853 RepID=C5BWW1_BEUC1|nr:type II toxin-antitoxin system antitoxin SocA domain-containing protein [Beutenbergia cavernae]ACQ80777.1 conserved hypothetical protein [Beutenbergia cavernae DSM 12333]